jgi:hypothetical protein
VADVISTTHKPNAGSSTVSTATARKSGAGAGADSGSMAVVAFVCGLVGLLFGNIVLGPAAIGLGITALRRGTTRRGRAALAIALGVADLAIFVLLAVHSAAGHGGVTWNFSTF